ncbi:MAG: CoA transferase [Firmicutes bacterium]|nr:CoA transferase [Bacillota bacterium]
MGEEWTRKQGKQEIVKKLTAAHVPCAPVVQLRELVHDEHIAARHMLPEVQHPTMGSVRIFGNPIHLAHSDEPEFGPSPLLGADTDKVLSSLLEMNEQQLTSLRTQGVIA